MPDFNPKEMDALFRDGAERHEFEYNPDAWALMEDKLDKKAKKRRVFFFLLGLMFLLGVVAVYSLLQVGDDKKQTEIATSISSNTIEAQKEELSNKLIENNKEPEANKASIATLRSSNTLRSTKEYISTDSKESRSNIGAQNSFQSENTGNLMGHEIVSIDSQIDLPKNEMLEDNALFQKEKDDKTNSVEIGDNSKLTRDLVVVSLLKDKEIQLLEANMVHLSTLKLQPSQSVPSSSVSQFSNRWAIAVFANPEWSSVGLFKESKAGWSVGAKIGFQFSNKFEVSAGVAFSRKMYKSGGEAYTMNGGWYDDIEPIQMDAKCDVIEIPIGLSYYINGFRKSGFFADIGINSYMLHSEWYGFEYDDALVRPDRYMDVFEDGENSHLIGVGRIAIGYQKVLSKNASFQVAPYLQFPLTGIGAGQVNVYSSGVQLAVKFNTQ